MKEEIKNLKTELSSGSHDSLSKVKVKSKNANVVKTKNRKAMLLSKYEVCDSEK